MVRFSPDYEVGDDYSREYRIRNPKRLRSSAGSASVLSLQPPEEESRVLQRFTEGIEEDSHGEESEYEGEGDYSANSCCREEEDVGVKLEDQSDGENEETVGDGSIPVILTDPDVLDCPICLEPFTIPVFQCENGHVACSACCTKTHNRCPSCSFPIGYNRCRAVEKIFESIKIGCRNAKYGCKETVKYFDKSNHEESCRFAPCSCPILECDHVNNSRGLYAHFGATHLSSAKSFAFDSPFSVCLDRDQKLFILRDNKEGRIFMVNNHIGEGHATAVSIVGIAPTSSKREYHYEISVRDGERTTIKLQSAVENIPAWIDAPPAKNFLLVPNHCKNGRQQLNLEVCIWNLYGRFPLEELQELL